MDQPELLPGLFLLCLIASSAAAWLKILPRLRRGEPLLPYEPRRHVPWGLLDLLFVFCLFFAAIVALGLFFSLAGLTSLTLPLEKQSPRDRAISILASAILECVVIALALVLVSLKNSASRVDLGVIMERARDDFRLGATAFILLAGPVFLVQATLSLWWPSEHPLIELVRKNPDLGFFLVSVFSAVLVAPIVEEFVFRVLLQGWMEKFQPPAASAESLLLGRFPVPQSKNTHAYPAGTDEADEPRSDTDVIADDNPYAPPRTVAATTADTPGQVMIVAEAVRPLHWPIIVSSAIFALMHLGHGPDPIALFLLALGLGFLYQRTHRIFPCVVVHFLLNSVSMGLLILECFFGVS